MSEYLSFIQNFPDEGQGVQIAYPHVNIQGYVTSMNSSYAAIVAQNPLVGSVVIDAPASMEEFGVLIDKNPSMLPADMYAPENQDVSLWKRAQPTVPTENLVRQPNSQVPLQIISQGAASNVQGSLEDYMFDPTAGEGITIYVLDSGFFQGATVRPFVLLVCFT
jgi:hypothetical protein